MLGLDYYYDHFSFRVKHSDVLGMHVLEVEGRDWRILMLFFFFHFKEKFIASWLRGGGGGHREGG